VDTWAAPEPQDVLPGPRMREVRAVDPIAAAALGGAIYGAFGLMGTALFGSIALLAPAGTAGNALIMAVCAPFLYATLGAILIGLMALFYNLAARVWGGVKVQLIPRARR
jgi:hypothetical protein